MSDDEDGPSSEQSSDTNNGTTTPPPSSSTITTSPAAAAAAAVIIDNSRYTHEQKIVAAVWVHEKEYNNQTWKDITANFWARFQIQPPNRSTFLSWERKLFSVGNVEDKEKCGRPLSRLMHVPYVKDSLREAPELSLRERSKLLGLPRTTLLKIIRDDLNMEFEVEQEGNNSGLKRRHAPYGGGKWKMKEAGGNGSNVKIESEHKNNC